MNGVAAGFALAGILLAALLWALALRGKLGKGGAKVAILVVGAAGVALLLVIALSLQSAADHDRRSIEFERLPDDTPAPALDASDVPRALYDKMMTYDVGRRDIVPVERADADRFWTALRRAGVEGEPRGSVAQVDGKVFAFRLGPIP